MGVASLTFDLSSIVHADGGWLDPGSFLADIELYSSQIATDLPGTNSLSRTFVFSYFNKPSLHTHPP
jgi:hypothetical protein